MPKRRLKDWLKSYLDFCSYSESPRPFHFWTGVSAIAGALRSQVWIDQGYFRWVPNFYIILVAPPGVVQKTTSINIGMDILREVPGIRFGPSAITWQSLIQFLGEISVVFEHQGESITMSAATFASGEFGTLLDPKDREMVDVLVSLWDGQIGVWEKKTKTSGNDAVVNPWINIIACTTRSWMQGNFPEHMIGGGFTSRVVFVYAERKQRLSPYPIDAVPPSWKKDREDLLHDLTLISQMIGPYELSAAAYDFGVEWYKDHNEALVNTDPDDRMGGYMSRKQTHIHKLAMIIAASKRDELIIRSEDLSSAEALVTSVEKAFPKVFAQINAPEARYTNRVIETLENVGPLSWKDCYLHLYQSMSYQDFVQAVRGAKASGLVYSEKAGAEEILKPRRTREDF